jgi:cytochrome c oxidase subunit IV
MRVLVGTLIALLVLTFVTVAATTIDLGGSLNLWLAMIIATVKATLVALYFMHLRYDKPFVAIILIVALLCVLLFVGLTLLDTVQYHADVQSWRDVDPSHYAPELDQR